MGPCPCGQCCVSPRGTWPMLFDCNTHTHTHTQTAFNQICPQYAENLGKMWPTASNLREAFDSLFFFDGIKAGVTHPHRELKAHDWVCGAFRTTFSTNSLATLPAVVLHKEKNKQYISMTDGLRDSKLGGGDTGQTLLPVWGPGS